MSNANNSHNNAAEAFVEDLLESGKIENPTTLSYPVNIRNTEHKYALEISAPGFRRSDFTIISEGGLLTITAAAEHKKNREDDNYTRKEYSKSYINRAFSLPQEVLTDQVTARYRNGILTIDLKKNHRFLIGKKHIKVD